MVLPEPIKTRVRVHMMVPVLGIQDSGFAMGYRFTNVMGLLEYRMNVLQPFEYAAIVGTPTAAAQFFGVPNVGDTVTLTIKDASGVVIGTPVTYTVTTTDANNADPNRGPTYSAIANACNAFCVAQAPNGFVASGQPTVSSSPTAMAAVVDRWQMAVSSQNGTAFTLTVATTGAWGAYVGMQGTAPVKPSTTFAEDGVTATGYIAICDYLEGRLANASDLVKFGTADVVSFRGNELDIRQAIYDTWCQRLATYLGIPLAPVPPVSGFGGSATGLSA